MGPCSSGPAHSPAPPLSQSRLGEECGTASSLRPFRRKQRRDVFLGAGGVGRACPPWGFMTWPRRGRRKQRGKEAKARVRQHRKKDGAWGSLTIGQPQGFEGGGGRDRVGGVDEVERGAEDPREDVTELLPGFIHAGWRHKPAHCPGAAPAPSLRACSWLPSREAGQLLEPQLPPLGLQPGSPLSAPSSSLSSEHPCIPAGLCLGGSSSHLVVPYAPLPGCSLLQAAFLPSSTTASCRTVAILTVPASHQGPSGKWLGGNSTLS